MTHPITAIIPTYNRSALVGRAIESAIAATNPDDEILIVDDGSTDDTLLALRRYGSRITILNGEHRGAGAARNLGLAHARHPWVAFLDSDDEWDSTKISLQRQLFEERDDILYIFSDFRVVRTTTGETYPRYLRKWMNDQRPWKEIIGEPLPLRSLTRSVGRDVEDIDVYVGDYYSTMLRNFCIATTTLMFRKTHCTEAARFAEDVPIYEDHQFFGQLTRCGLGAYVDAPTATNHSHPLPRLTGASESSKIKTLIKVTERVWGSDQAFLEREGSLYQAYRASLEQRYCRSLVGEMLVAGQFAQARQAVAKCDTVPLKIRALLALPQPLAHAALTAYRALAQRNSGKA